MLVFTRKRGEAIVIGDNIEVVILSAGKEGLRVGVRAPQSVPVHRKEIYDLIREENRTAAGALVAGPLAADRQPEPVASERQPATAGVENGRR